MVNIDFVDLTVLEIGSGIWFFLSLSLMVLFARQAVEQHRDGKSFAKDPTFRVAAALCIFTFGSAIRGALFWEEFNAIHRGVGSHLWINTWPWFVLSIYLNVLGAAWSVWELSPNNWRLCVMGVALALAISIPLLVYNAV